MEYNDIKDLLEKYWEANTSLEEEKLLADYFTSGNVHPDFVAYQPLFASYATQQKMELTANFDEKILQQIQEKEARPVVRNMYKRGLVWKVAASIALLIATAGMYYHINQLGNNITNSRATIAVKDTYQDPQLAMAEVQKALLAVSVNMNKGKKITQQKLTELNKMNEVIK